MKGPNADSVRWRKSGWESTSVTGAAASLIVGGVVLKVKGRIKQVGILSNVMRLLSNKPFHRPLRRV